jgi:hypothetical protein
MDVSSACPANKTPVLKPLGGKEVEPHACPELPRQK